MKDLYVFSFGRQNKTRPGHKKKSIFFFIEKRKNIVFGLTQKNRSSDMSLSYVRSDVRKWNEAGAGRGAERLLPLLCWGAGWGVCDQGAANKNLKPCKEVTPDAKR